MTRFLPEGAAILSVLYLANYVFALVRARTLAQSFGAGGELDAYVAASRLPELLFDVLVEAGLSAAFIPIFLRLRSRPDGVDDANRFARTVLTAATGCCATSCVGPMRTCCRSSTRTSSARTHDPPGRLRPERASGRSDAGGVDALPRTRPIRGSVWSWRDSGILRGDDDIGGHEAETK